MRAVWGSMTTGGGPASLNELMSTMGVGTMRREVYCKLENVIGDSWLKLLEEDMKRAGDEERELAIKRNDFHQGIPAITVICDGGWSKRSHKHSYNAMGGVAVIFGAATGKLLHIGVRNKYCFTCTIAESKKVRPPDHICFKNWSESSQAMESDIIVEGFLAAEEKHGVRYMRLIGDGDSSVYARIQEQVSVWGRDVKKLECSNHVCKCLRSSLEKLTEDKPHLKGKGRLSKQAICRITRGVRCAIRMWSSESNLSHHKAACMLAHDIRNSVNHVFGDHSHCSSFCKKKDTPEAEHEEQEQDIEVMEENECFWRDMLDEGSMEEARFGYKSTSELDPEIIRDVRFLLDRVAKKSEYLIGNFTTNLAESWMSIRCKFDGGKVINRCQRGSWNTRCYGGALRKNFGTAWSPLVWLKSTKVPPYSSFTSHLHQKAVDLVNSKKSKARPETRLRASKRKAERSASSSSKKARKEYGQNCLDGSPDISMEELDKTVSTYLDKEINIPLHEITAIEKSTTSQSISKSWKQERRKRLTSSNFGDIVSRNTSLKVKPLVNRLLYTNFHGNRYTRKGLQSETITIKEYILQKSRENEKVSVTSAGLVIDKDNKFLAASPDGYVTEQNGKGLIEVKNLLQSNQLSFEEAAKKSAFCLQLFEGKLCLKKNHKYYYQCQVQLNICKLDWVDFVVRRTNPYQLHIERIERDVHLWTNLMLPKLCAFYTKCILPELAHPRKNSVQGIREPMKPWYEPTATGKTHQRQKSKGISEPTTTRKTRQRQKTKDTSDNRGTDSGIVGDIGNPVPATATAPEKEQQEEDRGDANL